MRISRILIALVAASLIASVSSAEDAPDPLAEARLKLGEVCTHWPKEYQGNESRAATELETRLVPLNGAGTPVVADALLGEGERCKLPKAVLRRVLASLQKDKTVEQLNATLQRTGSEPDERLAVVAAVAALAERRDLTTIPAIAALLTREDQPLFELAKNTLLEFAATRAGGELVLRSLFENRTDASDVYLSHSIETAQFVRSRFTDQYLAEYLRHGSLQIRLGAIRGLAQQHANRELTRRIAAALNDKSPAVAKAAAVALRTLKSTDEFEPLIAALDHADASVRSTVNTVLKDLSGQTFGIDKSLWTAWLTQQREDDEQKFKTLSVVYAAATTDNKAVCLEEMAPLLFAREKVLNFALGCTHSNEFAIRAAALHLLSQTGDNAAIKPLIDGLSDSHQEVVFTAHRGLERLSGAHFPPDSTTWIDWFSRGN